mmetsp:Transcript_36306/g.54197  ORF Transcript_36306/g.54197 Transcript_36306/m.54197 type:complete len:93 (-) Transcript_36306:534-812(-)
MLKMSLVQDMDSDSISEIDCHIHIFLHQINVIDNILSDNNAKSYLESSYFYLGTRMFPEVINECGSVWNVWDRCYQGEAFISELKPLINDLR